MQSVDGDVRLSVVLDDKSVTAQAAKLSSAIKSAFGVKADTKGIETSFNNVSQKVQAVTSNVGKINDSKFLQLKNKVEETANALELARKKQEEYSQSAKKTGDSGKELQKAIEWRKATLSELKATQAEFQKYGETPNWDINKAIKEQSQELDILIRKQRELEAGATSYDTTSAKAQQYANAVEKAGNAHEVAKAKLNEYATGANKTATQAQSSFGKVTNAIIKVSSAANNVSGKIYGGFKTAFGKVVSVAKSALSKVRSHFSSTRKSSKGMFDDIGSGVKRGLKMLLRYGLGVRGLFVLFRKLRTAAKEGFKNLGGYSDSFNQQVSNLLSASLRLKNAFAAAFQPLASAVLPIVTKIVNGISDALTKLGELLAALTGQKYYYKAVNTTAKYVEKKTKSTVKKVQKYLSPLDDINLFNDKDTGGDTGDTDNAADPSKMFETKSVSDKFKDLADRIKALFKSKDWTELGRVLGESLNKALRKIPWAKIEKTSQGIARRIFTLINGFFGAVDWKLVGNTIANGLNTVFRFLSTVVNGLNWKLIGESLAELVTGFVDNFDVNAVISTITGLINGIAVALLAFATNINWAKIGKTISDGIAKLFNDIDWGTIILAVSAVANGIAELANKIFGNKKLGNSIGKAIANIFLTAINFAYNLIKNIDFGTIGEAISGAINTFLEEMAKVDENGLSGWAKLAQSFAGLAIGLLTLLTTALKNVNWEEVGQAIGDFLSNIDWGQIIFDFADLAWNILKAIADALKGWYGKDPISATLATMLGAILVSGTIMKKVISAGLRIKGLLDKIGIPKGTSGDTTKSLEDVGAGADSVSQGTSKLTSKLTSLVKNLALGIVVIAEVAIAAGIIVAAIWGLGILMQQVIEAWQPVIQNGETAIQAIGFGTAILVVIGVVCAALGSVGASLIVAMALGIAILVEIGISAALFLAEIWAIGWGLNQIIKAWKPVLKDGETVATAIGLGTAILVAIGVVCAALGVATVASVGLLPLAIGLGIGMLVEIGAAALTFIADIWAVGNALIKLIIPWSIVLKNGKTVEQGIKQGTTILIAVGAACALLGAASVASVGLLPLAINLGVKMLQDIQDATISLCDMLIKLADRLNKLATVLVTFNAIRPTLKKNLENYVKFMQSLAGLLFGYTKSALLAGFGNTIGTFIGFFANKPIKQLYDEITSQQSQFALLISGLEKIIPLIARAEKLIGTYKTRMGLFSNAAKSGTGLLGKTVVGTRNMANAIIGIFEAMANSAIRAINAIVQAANSLKFNIPDWIPDIGGKKFSFNLKPLEYINIPKLATGAVIPPNKEFMAVLGDQKHGNNIEAPESLLRRIMREERGGNNTYTVNAQVGAKTLFSIILDEAKLQQVQTGHSPFEMIKGV